MHITKDSSSVLGSLSQTSAASSSFSSFHCDQKTKDKTPNQTKCKPGQQIVCVPRTQNEVLILSRSLWSSEDSVYLS